MESQNKESLEMKAIESQTKFKDSVVKQIRLIITAILLLALLFYMLVKVTKSTADEDFWITSIVGIILHIAMILIWIPAGKEKGEELPSYIGNKKESARHISSILNSTEKLLVLDEFCDVATEENRIASIKNILGRAKVKYSDYVDKYALELMDGRISLSKEKIKRDKNLTRKQKSIILRVRKGVKVKPILSSSITSLDNDSCVIYDVSNHEQEKQAVKIATKLIANVFTSIALAFIAFAKADHLGLEQIAQFLVWTASVLVNIYTCRRIGILLVIGQRNAYHLRLIDFSCRFNAWLNNLLKQ